MGKRERHPQRDKTEAVTRMNEQNRKQKRINKAVSNFYNQTLFWITYNPPSVYIEVKL